MVRGLVLGLVIGFGVVIMQAQQPAPAGPKVAQIEKVKDNLYMITGTDSGATNMAKMSNFADPAKKFALPDKTFTDKMTLLSGADTIDLYYFGPGHTNGTRSSCSEGCGRCTPGISSPGRARRCST